ncbi:MAG: hypothetical protein IJ830_02825 [Alphaproteobacteria bacterium]|nr:hypothetical protein [Alphaproteobacteria bacterium]
MVKKILISFVLMIAILVGLYAWKTKTSDPIIVKDTPPAIGRKVEVYNNKVYAYDKDHLKTACDLSSPMACAVEYAIKCTLNPDFDDCRDSKLPKFIFMSDKSLKRPTQMTFKIAKIKPINNELIEIHTDSTCDGNWFGLCQGRVIYVLVPSNNAWRVKDIYAIEI